MPANQSTCTIDDASFESGIWYVRATIVTPQGTRSGPHQIEGDESMTHAALGSEIAKLYA
jgi:hypothetical protein